MKAELSCIVNLLRPYNNFKNQKWDERGVNHTTGQGSNAYNNFKNQKWDERRMKILLIILQEYNNFKNQKWDERYWI